MNILKNNTLTENPVPLQIKFAFYIIALSLILLLFTLIYRE